MDHVEIALLTTVVARCWESLQRVHALNALRENEERYRLIVEQASDGIWLADDDGQLPRREPGGLRRCWAGPTTSTSR